MEDSQKKTRQRKKKPTQSKVNKLVASEEKKRGYKICGAWKPTKGGVCCRRPIKGRKRCKDDGGLTPIGEASIHYKGLGYSRHLPTRYRDDHQELMEKPEAVEMLQDIVLSHQRVQELIESMDMEGSYEHWKELREIITVSKDIADEAGGSVPAEILNILSEKVTEGLADYKKHKDIQQAQNHKRDLLLANARLHKESGTVININQYNIMLDQWTSVLVSEIHDRKLLDRVIRKLI